MARKQRQSSSDPFNEYVEMALGAGARDAKVIPASDVSCAEWVRLRCQYGCSGYGGCLTCPPYSPTPETTQRVVSEFKTALLIHGDRNADVSEIAADIERQAFLDGHYKALSFHSGPCHFCPSCDPQKPCRNPYRARPAMEASGIDVFATARKAGLPIEVVRDRDCEGNYYSLVLIE